MGGGGGYPREALLIALCASLILSSTVIAFVANDYYQSGGWCTDVSCQPITGFTMPKMPSATMYEQDYTNTSGYDPNVTIEFTDLLGTYGEWTQSSNGYELTAGPGLLEGDPVLKVDSIVPDGNGVYSVSYLIKNPTNAEFFICPRWLGAGHTKYDIRLQFKPEGVEYLFMETFFLSAPVPYASDYFPDAQVTESGGSVYKLVYDEPGNSIEVYKDGVLISEQSNLPYMPPTENLAKQGVYYGAVGSSSVGFTLVKVFDTKFLIQRPEDVGTTAWGNFWDGLINWMDNMIPGLGAIVQFSTMVGQVMLWTLPENVLPLWLNMALIKTQVAGIVYMLVQLYRGT